MTLWTPAQLTTAMWLDSADSATLFDAVSGGNPVAADGAVARWQDKSGNARNFTQSTPAARPTRRVAAQNGLDVVEFPTSVEMVSAAAVDILKNVSAATIFAVRRYATTPLANRVCLQISNGLSGGSARAVLAAGGVSQKNVCGGRRLDANSFVQISSSVNATTAYDIQCGIFDYANADLIQYIDGTKDGENLSFQTAGNTSDTNSVSVTLGSPGTAGNFLVGFVAEVLVFRYALASSDRFFVEGYLAWKWGIESKLPAAHPFKSFAPGGDSGASGGNPRLINGSLIQ